MRTLPIIELNTSAERLTGLIASPYLTATEAAVYLRTTIQGIYARVKRGRLKPMPGSTRLLFTREALDTSLQKIRR